MNIEYNYHTHNHRCGHAGGDCYDYANEAVKKGIKKLGFSDHGPFKDFDPGFRMAYALYPVRRRYAVCILLSVGAGVYDAFLVFGGIDVSFVHRIAVFTRNGTD